MSNVFNYQSKLEFLFTAYLNKQQLSSKTITNYKSDLRYFFAWLIENFNQTEVIVDKIKNPQDYTNL